MANDLNDHVGIHGRPFTPERVLAGGFGPAAAFTPLVAELDGAVVGYAFFSAGYNTDVAARSIFLHDLFVTAAARGRGVGYALMGAVAAGTVRAGFASLGRGGDNAHAGAHEVYPQPVPDPAAPFGWRYACREVFAASAWVTPLAVPAASIPVSRLHP